MRNISKFILVVGLWVALLGTTAKAQYEDGSLTGTIHDATGAVVTNAAVIVTNANTGIATKVTTNGSGDYEVPSLRVGTYGIKAEAPGFMPVEAKNISIAIGARVRIDLTLKVGEATTTTVEVSDVALQLETETSERGQTISGYQTEALPLVSRNFSDLLALVTGSRQAPTAGDHQLHQQPGAPGRIQRQRPAQHVQQLPARRHGQQRIRREQPGLRQPDHRHSAGFGCAVQRGHEQRERRVRPVVRRDRSTWPRRAAPTASTRCLRISPQHRSSTPPASSSPLWSAAPGPLFHSRSRLSTATSSA